MSDTRKIIESMTPDWFKDINKKTLQKHDHRTMNEACFDSGVMAAAPKDGTRVLVYSQGGLQYVCWREGRHWAFYQKYAGPTSIVLDATHWQPLPTPPGELK